MTIHNRLKLRLRPHIRRSTAFLRLRPDFIIVGAQKCGTSTLYSWLSHHPQVLPVTEKELHYFDVQYHRGTSWYRSQFALIPRQWLEQIRHGAPILTGEATPYYLFHPHALRRIADDVPQVKIIVLLRNPCDRAYSHYYHNVRMQRESLSFEEAIAQENDRLLGEAERMQADETYHSFNYQHYSYLRRGIYVDQICALQTYIPPERLLILKSEAFFQDPGTNFRQVLRFLGLADWQPKQFRAFNTNTYGAIAPQTRSALETYFAPHNERLYRHLGMDFAWSKATVSHSM